MSAATSATRASKKRVSAPARPPVKEAEPGASDSRFDRKFREIQEHATDVFFEKGYEGASMRDLSRVSGMSLAGLYYYFESKEKLLFLIQRHTFRTVIERLHERLARANSAEQRIRAFIENHLEYFLANMRAMKVLSHEADALGKEHGAEIAELKREYYQLCCELLRDVRLERGIASASRGSKNGASKQEAIANETRVAALSLFGTLNWIYTWYNPRLDGTAEQLAQRMGDIFLMGILNTASAAASAGAQQSS